MVVAATNVGKYDIFEAADAMQVPVVSVAVYSDTDPAKVDMLIDENLKSAKATDVKKLSTEELTLADGKTKGDFAKWTWKSGAYGIVTYALGVKRGDKTISVTYANLDSWIDAKIAKEVCCSLTFK
jgi:hypothetical protein